jgi:hypothetical protein
VASQTPCQHSGNSHALLHLDRDRKTVLRIFLAVGKSLLLPLRDLTLGSFRLCMRIFRGGKPTNRSGRLLGAFRRMVSRMLLLHLSDIHFRSSDIQTAQDPNFNLRNEILRDAEEMCAQLGASPSAILVSGDIAYAAQVAEYEFATAWLKSLAEACGTTLDAVFVIPGNHDVDRRLAARPLNYALHEQIKATTSIAHQAMIQGLLSDTQAGRVLYEPLDAYNLFAGQFLCDLNAPNRTRAVRDLTLNDGSILRLWGLNSAFVSSAADEKEALFIDSASLQITREVGVENLVLVHHPPEWLRDGSLLKDHLNAVARIHLFGHEHVGRIEQSPEFLRLRAGAAHPDRNEPGWEPGYNVIELAVDGSDEDRELAVKVHVRVWRPAVGRFQAQIPARGTFYAQKIKLDAWKPVGEHHSPTQSTDHTVSAVVLPPEIAPSVADMTNLREIGIRFYALTFSKKSEIAGALGLLDDADVNQPDYERFRRVFMRAHERGQLNELSSAIDAANDEQATPQ